MVSDDGPMLIVNSFEAGVVGPAGLEPADRDASGWGPVSRVSPAPCPGEDDLLEDASSRTGILPDRSQGEHPILDRPVVLEFPWTLVNPAEGDRVTIHQEVSSDPRSRRPSQRPSCPVQTEAYTVPGVAMLSRPGPSKFGGCRADGCGRWRHRCRWRRCGHGGVRLGADCGGGTLGPSAAAGSCEKGQSNKTSQTAGRSHRRSVGSSAPRRRCVHEPVAACRRNWYCCGCSDIRLHAHYDPWASDEPVPVPSWRRNRAS